jgi:26S proteasome regulatory subunit N5
MAHSGAAAGGELEEKVDLTPETDAKLEQSAQLAKGGSLNEALALLAALEKRCRVGNDNPNLVRVCEASLQYCKDAGDSETLLITLQTLATRRSQKTQAVRALVHKCIPWCMADQYSPLPVSSEEEKTAREKLVVALREITDGKIFLEGERARLTRALATIKVGFAVARGTTDPALLYGTSFGTWVITSLFLTCVYSISLLGTRRRRGFCRRCFTRGPR